MLSKDAAEAIRARHKDFLAAELAAALSHKPGSHLSVLQGQWKGVTWPGSKDAVRDPETGVDHEALQQVGRASVSVPEGFVSRLNGRSLREHTESEGDELTTIFFCYLLFPFSADPWYSRKSTRGCNDM